MYGHIASLLAVFSKLKKKIFFYNNELDEKKWRRAETTEAVILRAQLTMDRIKHFFSFTFFFWGHPFSFAFLSFFSWFLYQSLGVSDNTILNCF